MSEISIIIPVFNTEDYLDECIQSLERQTFNDFEVIFIDDCSTDKSTEIIKKYINKHTNWKMLRNDLRGGSGTCRNRGLQEAEGKYIYFMDSDDCLIDNALERLHNRAEKDELDCVLFSYYFMYDDGRPLKWSSYVKFHGNYPAVINGRIYMKQCIDNNDFCALIWSIFSRREILEKNDIRPLNIFRADDGPLRFEIVTMSERIGIINEPLYCYRVREGNWTNTKHYKLDYVCQNKVIQELDAFSSAHKMGDIMYDHIYRCVRSTIEAYYGMTHPERKETKGITCEFKKVLKKYQYFKKTYVHLFSSFTTGFLVYRKIGLLVKGIKTRKLIKV